MITISFCGDFVRPIVAPLARLGAFGAFGA